MKISNLVGAAAIAVASLASTSAFAQVPGSNYYFDRSDEIARQDVSASTGSAVSVRTEAERVPGSSYYRDRREELVRQNIAASATDGSATRQGTVRAYGYAAGDGIATAPRTGVPGSRFFMDRNDEIVRQQIR
ncbi:hypothetical protein [Antarcticirhabdus aurantiaca]|uniref:Uncharacterized protein n=1 Tax=Antarcticirhabdus aurantiaca TaxID=2606717 RepID=A0ACD4NQY4_9HYPH|nr:hypothetical protein [Antarcticirhabdus aurantiaca]WAJ29060.1 hypothetical protein OXU80_02090 [Jeongeuplla avenae]